MILLDCFDLLSRLNFSLQPWPSMHGFNDVQQCGSCLLMACVVSPKSSSERGPFACMVSAGFLSSPLCTHYEHVKAPF